MLDNLRRSFLAPSALPTLFVGWTLRQAGVWTVAVLILTALPFSVVPGRAGVTSRSHLGALWDDIRAAAARVSLNLILLADTAWAMLKAIIPSLVRLGSRRYLLECMTTVKAREDWAAQAVINPQGLQDARALAAKAVLAAPNPALSGILAQIATGANAAPPLRLAWVRR